MNTFKYEAISLNGVEINGVIEASDATEAVIKLKETCRTVTNLKEVTSADQDIFAKFEIHTKIKSKSLSMVCKQFSIILSAGLPIVRSVELVAAQATDKNLKKILTDVASDVASGYSMADSFANRAPQLPTTFIETVRAGEESGSLDGSFRRLSEYYSKQDKTRSKVISALTYPAFVMVVAVVVIAIIMIYAVPQFTTTFAELGTEMPLPTRLLIGLSDFMRESVWVILAIIVAIVLAYKLYASTPNGKIRVAKIKLRIPVLGPIQLMNASSQFANTLSTMLAAGLSVIKSLAVTGKSLSNAYLSSQLESVVMDVESGYQVGQRMRSTAFPPLLTEMTSVGEESGSLEETLNVIGEYYDNEVDTVTSRAVSLLEPVIICVLAVFVVWVLMAVYLPMFSMYDSVG